MKPHKHAELIKAWADGAEIEIRTQYTDGSWSRWEKMENPKWDISYGEYRIKPEPKPDVETYRRVILLNDGTGILYATMDNNALTGQNPNVKFIFDGNTGDLIKAEVLK